MASVLVAEDEVLIRADIVECLQEGGHRVVGQTGDGDGAVSLARQLTPDLVVMDVKMPGLDGVGAAARIREESGSAVVLLTAFSAKELVAGAAEAGAMAYLVKPFQPEQLLATVDVALVRAGERSDLRATVGLLEAKLAARKSIERAKGRLMEHFGLTEEEAFAKLRRTAMDRQVTLEEVARRVLESPAHPVAARPRRP